MAALAWGVAVPASLWLTRSLGSAVSQSLLGHPTPEPLDESIDAEGAIAAAKVALRLLPVSPTAMMLRNLVETSLSTLENQLQSVEARQQRTSLSRLFRDPCFRRENIALRKHTKTLMSRVRLFLCVMATAPVAGHRAPGTDQKDIAESGAVKEKERKAAWAHALNDDEDLESESSDEEQLKP